MVYQSHKKSILSLYFSIVKISPLLVLRWAIWVFEGRRVDIIVDKNRKEWFRSKDVCRILEFKNINDTILKGVKQSHKTDLKSLVELTCVDHANSTSNHEGKTVACRVDMRGSCLLNLLSWRQNSLHLLCWAARRSEPGLYKLVFASRLETAEAFQDWVCDKVLPSIRKTGSYDNLFK